MSENNNSGFKTMMGFLVGGAIGAGLALLYAPASGEETRRRIRERAEKAKARTKEGYNAAMDNIEDRIETVKTAILERKDAVKAAYDAGKDAYEKEKLKHAA